jgi:hypothetical protein
MMKLPNAIHVLATGFIFFYFSELLFWARPRPGDSPGGWLVTWMVYFLLALAFLAVVRHFCVRSTWAVFLAGAVFGWLGEGLVVQTAYEQLPFSISFTGLAWHAAITVLAGWYFLRRAIHSPNPRMMVWLSAGIGLAYGLWASGWWIEPDGGVSSLGEFGLFSFIPAGIAALAYWLLDCFPVDEVIPSKWLGWLLFGSFGLYFLFVTVPSQPVAAVILPVLLGTAYLGLRWNREAEERNPVLVALPGPAGPARYLILLLIPGLGVSLYAVFLSLNVNIPVYILTYFLIMPLGFILFFLSMYRVWQTRFHSKD